MNDTLNSKLSSLVALKEELINLDKKFDLAVSTGGAEAWASYFHEDGVMLTSGSASNKRGKKEIFDTMNGVFGHNDFSLRWEPTAVDVSDSGDLGYTYGNYIRKYKDSTNQWVTSTGKYTSIWKKDCTGQWKIVLDIGT